MGALHWAVDRGHHEVVKALLSHRKTIINIIDKEGYSPLIIACRNNFVEIVRTLLKDVRVDVDIQDFDGSTALHSAVERNCVETVKLLLACPQIDKNIRNRNRQKAEDLAN